MAARLPVRLLLLVLVAFGIIGMHTTGHSGVGHGGAIVAEDHQVGAGAPMRAAPASAGIVLMPEGMPAGIDMDQWRVCLAVLTGVAVFVLIAALLRGTGRLPGWAAPPSSATSTAGRDPPLRPPIGLLLTDLSVLRT
jgi:hypothetical protein